MNDDLARRERAKRMLATIGWCFAIGFCVLPWVAGTPRLAMGLQAWHAGGAEATVVYPRSIYKGSPTGGWSESARSAIGVGLGWLAVGAITTGGLAWMYVARCRRGSASAPSTNDRAPGAHDR